MSDPLADVLAQTWATHAPAVLERLEVVRRALLADADGDLADGPRDEAVSAAHKLAGALGMYGFAAASDLAARAGAALTGSADDRDELAAEVARTASELARR